ncbi:MAG: transcriptional repressor [Thermomicrobiales bacterium]|nr:MAG: transcriptional repressor [Thermomicrobiales bacterium]
MDTAPHSITTEAALAMLAEHGYRATTPRCEVVENVMQQVRPFTAEQIVLQLPEISRATVYRTLEIMASLDLLSRLLKSDGHPAYVVGEPGHRHHLICSGCGYVVAFTTCPVEPVVTELGKSHDFAIQGHSLEIFGLCHECQG